MTTTWEVLGEYGTEQMQYICFLACETNIYVMKVIESNTGSIKLIIKHSGDQYSSTN